jgi:hypothetical protein
MFQTVPGIYDALSKTFCAVVSLLLIRFHSVCVVKVRLFQRQVENGTSVELFGWLRANVVQGVTGQDSFFRGICPNFCTEGKARAVRSHRQRLPSACHSFKFSITSGTRLCRFGFWIFWTLPASYPRVTCAAAMLASTAAAPLSLLRCLLLHVFTTRPHHACFVAQRFGIVSSQLGNPIPQLLVMMSHACDFVTFFSTIHLAPQLVGVLFSKEETRHVVFLQHNTGA